MMSQQMKARSAAKWIALVAVVTFGSVACSAQSKKLKPGTAGLLADTLAAERPKVNMRVNKVYDANGNLLQYDSTFTSICTGSDSLRMDSLMFRFMEPFSSPGTMGMFGPGLNERFFNDSLPGYDFFHDDFFRKRIDLMQDMMQRMDSLKNQFFQELSSPPQQDNAGTL